jgi:hypothetical protein
VNSVAANCLANLHLRRAAKRSEPIAAHCHQLLHSVRGSELLQLVRRKTYATPPLGAAAREKLGSMVKRRPALP